MHLLSLIGSVALPPTVHEELRLHAPAFPAALPPELQVEKLSSSAHERASAWQQAGLLHRGEAEALALAVATQPDWFLTDDTAARLMAEALGIETHGSLGVVLWAAANRLVTPKDAEAILAGLEKSSLWMSPRVRAAARSALKQMLR